MGVDLLAAGAAGDMAGLLVIGFICNACIRAVHERHHMAPETADATVPALGGR
jgi:hypothetical protein